MGNGVVGVSYVFFFAVRQGPGKCGQDVGFVSAVYLWAVNAQTRKCEISGAVPIFCLLFCLLPARRGDIRPGNGQGADK